MSLIDENSLPQYTVRISHQGAKIHDGTGFFVAPNLILTCSHVYRDTLGKQIQIQWQGKTYGDITAIDLQTQKDALDEDLALLVVNDRNFNAPYLPFDDRPCKTGDELFSFGYPADKPKGDVTAFQVTGIDGENLLKFKADRVIGGMSGSPLLNLKTKKIL